MTSHRTRDLLPAESSCKEECGRRFQLLGYLHESRQIKRKMSCKYATECIFWRMSNVDNGKIHG